MSYEAWIAIGVVSGINLSTIMCGIVHITSRLARIETDIAWLKKNGSKCQPNLENPLE